MDASRVVGSWRSFLCDIFLSYFSMIVLGKVGKKACVEERIGTEGTRSLWGSLEGWEKEAVGLSCGSIYTSVSSTILLII